MKRGFKCLHFSLVGGCSGLDVPVVSRPPGKLLPVAF